MVGRPRLVSFHESRCQVESGGGAVTLLWLLIWFIAGHEALILDPVNAWAATLILAAGLDLARPNVVPGRKR